MKKLSLITALSIGLLSTPSTLLAQDLYINAKAGAVSNYVYRGVTMSDEELSAQASIYLLKNGFYGGGVAAQVDFGTDDKFELDYYGGYLYTIDRFNLNIEYYSTNFDGETDSSAEVLLGVSFPCYLTQDLTWSFKYSKGLDEAPDNYYFAGEYNFDFLQFKADYNDYDKIGRTAGVSISKSFNISSYMNLDTSLNYTNFKKETYSYYPDQDNIFLSVMLSF